MFLLVACHKAPDPVVPPPSPVSAPVPASAPVDGARDAMVRALSTRDGAPACASVEALSADPVGDLTWIVENVGMPPTAPMIAAACLLDGHAEDSAGAFEGWLSTDGHAGLAALVVQRLERLPAPVAVRYASVGLRGPYVEVIRPAVAASARPEVRAELLVDPGE